jgi:hypothetical protein
MHSIVPYCSVTPDPTNLDTGARNYCTSQLTHVTASHQQNTDVTIMTAEGDKVTLSSSSQSQATFTTYDGFARTVGASAWFQAKRLDIDVARELSISVEGNLDEQELKDIEKAMRAIGRIVRDFLSGRIDRAVARALRICNLESISSLNANLRYEQTVSLTQQLVTEVSSPPPELAEDITSRPNPVALEPIDKVIDKMIDVVQDSGVKPAKLRKPIRGLFAKLLKELPREDLLDSPQHAIAKHIKTELLDRIEHLSEKEGNKGKKMSHSRCKPPCEDLEGKEKIAKPTIKNSDKRPR